MCGGVTFDSATRKSHIPCGRACRSGVGVCTDNNALTRAKLIGPVRVTEHTFWERDSGGTCDCSCCGVNGQCVSCSGVFNIVDDNGGVCGEGALLRDTHRCALATCRFDLCASTNACLSGCRDDNGTGLAISRGYGNHLVPVTFVGHRHLVEGD